ncbi:MAG: NAD(P)/FAD-dependent oxidoreductase [Actinomycetota bacterium]
MAVDVPSDPSAPTGRSALTGPSAPPSAEVESAADLANASEATPRPNDSIVVIGAGPAGLTAAHQLGVADRTCVVLEADDQVGGISRTVEVDGYRFDIGGHRFFTKVDSVRRLWREILPESDWLVRDRLSRIRYRGRFFAYPIEPLDALRNLGPVEALRCAGSYLAARVRRSPTPVSLEDYVVANYGRRLHHHFFATYTEKVWGVPASELSADWGAQRIKGMSLWDAVWTPIGRRLGRRVRTPGEEVTSLIERFHYPRLGPGMLWERCRDLVEAQGSKVLLETAVVRLDRGHDGVVAVAARHRDGGETVFEADHVVSSMPLAEVVRIVEPPAPAEVLAAADGLRFRDFLCVALVLPAGDVTWTDNWIYLHEPSVSAMRVQNFGSWSPELVRDGRNVLGVEYTVHEGDEAWGLPDADLVRRATDELASIGLLDPARVEQGHVVRMPKAYPVYDHGFHEDVATIRTWMETHLPNLHPVGRNGMHRYNNQDHSMLTAMLTVENILDAAGHDIWSVNVDEEYHEEVTERTDEPATGRSAPVLPRPAVAPT